MNPTHGNSRQPAAQTVSTTQIQSLLQRLGHALTAGDADAVADCFETPSLMLGPEGPTSFSNKSQIADLFKKAVQAYRSQGIVATTPELQRVDPLSEQITAVDVRWPGFDKSGSEKWSERSHYIMHRSKDGDPRICVALTRTLGQ